MSTLMLRRTGRPWLLLLPFLLLAASAFGDSITIGTLTFLGFGTPGQPAKAAFEIYLDTSGMTYDSTLGLPYSLDFDVTAYGWDEGVFHTWGPTSGFFLAPHFCPCEEATVNLTLLYTSSFKLADGRTFYPSPSITATMYAPPGQPYLHDGQSMTLVLNSIPSPVPEPASLVLFANGVLAMSGILWWRRRAKRAKPKPLLESRTTVRLL
jgi:hypothetical protein